MKETIQRTYNTDKTAVKKSTQLGETFILCCSRRQQKQNKSHAGEYAIARIADALEMETSNGNE